MPINVTPIPRLVELATPALTLGTANAAGSATTAIASDSTLLVFDTTDPAAVAASASVGSATTAPRRDHVHPGMTAAGTVVDEAIARFNGTGGASLQGYSSYSPTISDAGVMTLTSGQLTFPATQRASTGANVLDDYEEGSWTPQLADANLDGTGEGQNYSVQLGRYTKVGNRVMFSGHLVLTSIGTLSGGAFIIGLPFTVDDTGNNNQGCIFTVGASLAIPAGTSITGSLPANQSYISLQLWELAAGTDDMTCAQFSDGGRVEFNGQYQAIA